MQYARKKSLSEMLNKMEIDADKDDENNNDNDDDLKYLVSILPDVTEKLKEHDQLEIYKKWCTLVKGKMSF